jgi:restriction system protein
VVRFRSAAASASKQWEASQPTKEEFAGDDSLELEEADTGDKGLIAAATLEEAEEAARQAILDYLATVNPYRFQDLVGKLLEAMGYHVVWIAPKGRDGGLDVIAQGDPLGVQGPRIKGQVKRRANDSVGEDELRSFLSLVEPDDVGVYISLGGFTSGAEAAGRRSSRRITLIDGEGLLDLWVEHWDRLSQEGRELLPIKPVYFLDIEAGA